MATNNNQIQTFLASGDVRDRVALAKLEKSLSFNVVFQSEEPLFKNILEKDQGVTMETISKLIERFLSTNYPESNVQEVSLQSSMDILHMWPLWNILDVLHFLRFVRQRQDLPEMKVYGNNFKMTPVVLMKLATVYEEERSYALQSYIANKNHFESVESQKQIGAGEKEFKEVDALSKKLGNRMTERQVDQKVDLKAQKINQWHRENDLCHKFLERMLFEEQITKEQAQCWWSTFWHRKTDIYGKDK